MCKQSNKQEVIDSIVPARTYLGKDVRKIVESISIKFRAERLAIGDMIYSQVGAKRRPCVIIKMFKDTVLAIPMSTTKDHLNLCSYNSRIHGKGYLAKSIVIVDMEFAKENFMSILDDTKAIEKGVNKLKNLINQIDVQF